MIAEIKSILDDPFFASFFVGISMLQGLHIMFLSVSLNKEFVHRVHILCALVWSAW